MTWKSPFWTVLGRAALIVAAAAAVYAPAMRGGLVWDDHLTFSRLSRMTGWAGFVPFWSGEPGVDYLPIKQSLYWVIWHFFGSNPLPYHLLCVGLHILSAFLLWRVLARLGVARAWLGGLLFAVHPLAVESVAWMSEIKNTLSLPFLLLALDAWLEWRESKRMPWYFLSLLWFLLSLLSKPSGIMLPFFLVVLDWYRARRLTKADVAAAAPFFALGLILGLVAITRQETHIASGPPIPLEGMGVRLAVAGMAPWFYLSKWLLPTRLLLLYPRWPMAAISAASYLPWAALAAVLAWFLAARRGWGAAAGLGVAWLLFHLAPVAGFVRMSYLHHSWVADHFAYIFLAGSSGLLLLGFNACARRNAAVSWSVVALGLVSCAAAARAHAVLFEREVDAWAAVVAAAPNSADARASYGEALIYIERFPEAAAQLEIGHRLRPQDPTILANLCMALYRSGRLAQAESHDREALQIWPNHVVIRFNLGLVLEGEGRFFEAAETYRSIIRIDPNNSRAHQQLGSILIRAGRLSEAEFEEREAVRLDLASPASRNDLGTALGRQGKNLEAAAQYREALRLRPDYVGARDNLKVVLESMRAGERAP